MLDHCILSRRTNIGKFQHGMLVKMQYNLILTYHKCMRNLFNQKLEKQNLCNLLYFYCKRRSKLISQNLVYQVDNQLKSYRKRIRKLLRRKLEKQQMYNRLIFYCKRMSKLLC